jgi:nitrite reductase/ring-hydroxylating ferredoxin subunit
MDRRNFLKQGCTACLSMTVLSTFVSSCVATQYNTGKLSADGISINKNDFKVKQKGSTAFSSFIIVRNDALKFPICVYRINENEYTALWMRCTHQGAELQASGDVVHCTAHGSEFNNKGEVRNGPAGNNLKTFPVKINNDEIFIDLRKQA